jgi:hypothetical protein
MFFIVLSKKFKWNIGMKYFFNNRNFTPLKVNKILINNLKVIGVYLAIIIN